LRLWLTVLAAVTCAALVAGGCGGDDSGTAGTTPSAYTNPRAETPPKGSSTVLREVYRQFYPPVPDPQVKGSAAAIERGEEVCIGKRPIEIREEFIDESDLLPDQAEAVAELGKYEKRYEEDASFVAGQLAALVYERTLPEDELAMFGYQGCVYALSQVLKRRLAPQATSQKKP
jgi:hypothetical protein